MDKTRTIIFISFLMLGWLFISPLQAQPCGTLLTQEQINHEITLPAVQTGHPLQKIKVTLSITTWEIGKDSIHYHALTEAIERLNTHFSPIGIQFILCDYKLISNSNYSVLNSTNKDELLVLYQDPNTINLYLLDSIEGGYAAFTYYPESNTNLIFLRTSNLTGNHLTHQMGHFFGLYHTHETEFGNELADVSNCETAGDRLCDTPADPDLSDKVNNCQYIGVVTDANGTYYLPTVSNFMSFSPDTCRCFFTPEQYTKMVQTYFSHKQHLR